MSEAAAYKFNVAMTCSGCSGAVERALKKQEGVSKIDISLETQTVLVHAHPPATFDIVREKIAKTGKTINSIDDSRFGREVVERESFFQFPQKIGESSY
ncbi:Cytosolic copper metallochaperone [Puccinia graminis f. sp. tritici]|uniref:Cytosolic copper metallochaperone n=1 Tax=Puccinia graminis f. sp. tritici TaxID=56615 RepID=A0A5B0PUE8_PUCGR|nr:Cytosolic copper metallochaperone [Puccinia graminis f. sp. tritici]